MINWLSEHWLQLLLVVAYLAMLAYHAWHANRRMREEHDAPNASRMPAWMIAVSFYATFVSTNTFIGHAGKSWDVGLIWYVKLVFYVFFVLLAWYVLAPRYVKIRQQYGAPTLAAVLGCRYKSPPLRTVCAAVVLIASVVYLVAVYRGSAFALQQFFGVNYHVAAIIIFVVVTGYTAAGGFRAVVLTDVVQGLFLAVGAVAILIGVLVKGDGLPTILQSLHDQDPDLVSWHGKMPLMTVLGLALAGGIKLVVDPRQIERFNGLGEPKAVRWAGVLALLLMVVTYVCLLPIGAFAHALISENAISTSDEVMPHLLGTTQVLGPALSSFFLLVLLAGAMSSLDSVLLVASSTVSHDLLATGDDKERRYARPWMWIAVLSLAAMLLSFNPFGDIVEITAFSGSLYAACFLPTLLLGLYWKRGTAAGAMACILVGSTTVIGGFLANRLGWTSWHEIYAGLAAGLVSYVAVSMATSNRAQGPREQHLFDKL